MSPQVTSPNVMSTYLAIDRVSQSPATDWLRSLWQRYILPIFQMATVRAPTIGPESTDEALMDAYLNGHNHAFRLLFDRYAPKIMRAALHRGLSRADANDAVQQTFIHLHQGRHEFCPGSSLRPWLYTIAFNVMRDFGRRVSSQARLKKKIKTDVNDKPAAEVFAKNDESKKIASALLELSAPQREVLLLHYYQDMSFGEIATMLGSRENTIRVRAHRAYQKMRQILSSRAMLGGAQ